MSEQKEFKWYNWNLILTDNWVIITRWLKWFLLWWWKLRWDKTIPYSSIVAVQLKKAWFTAWYIQLTLKWWSEAKWWLFQSAYDENSINFYSWRNKEFEEAKSIIENKIWYSEVKKDNSLDDLEKLAWLYEKKIITKKEYEAKKKQLLWL